VAAFWRNGLGATAIASFSPRVRPGATVATPVGWSEVTPELDPAAYTIRILPERLARLASNPWEGFGKTDQRVPDLIPKHPAKPAPATAATAAPKRESLSSLWQQSRGRALDARRL
jgi:bifunctional non-homologous end joining protein LigD